ncbi:MAG TPA: hypothetical protein VFH68_20520 [Polyangia bacterium]|jgi:hypothetical protein|nr:hypothetical protein [Polyangia bacterium]
MLGSKLALGFEVPSGSDGYGATASEHKRDGRAEPGEERATAVRESQRTIDGLDPLPRWMVQAVVMTLERYGCLVAAGAWYDLAVTLPFATPFGAAWTFGALRKLHDAAHLGGVAPPRFLPEHLLFVAFFGTVVVLWSLVRIVFRRPADGAADTIGRVAFASWMAWALANGVSHLVAVTLVLEFGWAIAQGVGYWRLHRAGASSSHAYR